MAQESCNLDKDEAEILKSSSSPSPSPSPTNPPPPSSSSTASPPSPPPLFLKPSHEFPLQTSSPPSPKKPSAKFLIKRPETSPAKVSCKLNSKEKSQPPPVPFSNRCSSCRKRVGLTGFRCRCGDLFCASHRYSDTHDCSFDYKAAGREEISKANPVIRAAKIIRI